MIYYRRYIGSYQKRTTRLSMRDHGAYALMLDFYYAEEQPLPLELDDIYDICKVRTPDDRKSVDKVLRLHFEKRADGYHNGRADKEIAKARDGFGLFGLLKRLPRHVRNALQARRRARLKRAAPPWLNAEHTAAIAALYCGAARQTAATGVEHQVDHIVPLVHPAVCGLHVPWNLEVITAASNALKSNRFEVV